MASIMMMLTSVAAIATDTMNGIPVFIKVNQYDTANRHNIISKHRTEQEINRSIPEKYPDCL